MNCARAQSASSWRRGWWVCLAFVTGCASMASPDIRQGDLQVAEGKWEAAMGAYQRALKQDPFNVALLKKYEVAKTRTSAQYEERGRALLKERQIDAALDAFKRALSIEPSNPSRQQALTEGARMKEAADLAREADKLAQLGRMDEAIEAYSRAAELDPSAPTVGEGISRLTEEQESSRHSNPMGKPVTLKFKSAGLKEVLESVARINGFNVLFDKDVRNDPVSVAIEDTPFDEALELVLNSNSLFSKQVGPHMLLISPNTRQKQEQYQDLMIRTFYLSHTKAKDMVTLLKNMLDTKRLHANEQINTIVIRDTPEKVQLAERIILANDREEPEVVFDVEVLEVNRTKAEKYGLNYPKQAGVGMVPPGFTGTIAGDMAQQFTYRQLTSIGQDSFLFKLPTNMVLDFFKSVTDAKTLASPKLRVVNNRKGEVNIGDKQPILLSTTNVLPGQAATGAVPTTSTVTSVEFRDTGVKLTVEPSIRLTNDLSLKMKIEVIRIGDKVLLQASPPIEQFRFGNRSAETTLSMKDGETIVLAGLIQEEDRKVRVSMPWLGDIPVIGDWFSSFQTERVTTEVILTITPHLLQNRHAPRPETQVFWSGTDSQYATKPLFSLPIKRTSLSSSGASDARPRRPMAEIGAKPGQTPTAQAGLDASALAPMTMSFQPNDQMSKVGQEVRVALTTGNDRGGAPAVGRDAALTLHFDPAILELRTLTEGGALKAQGGSLVKDAAVESEPGTVAFGIRQGSSGQGDRGDLVVATFLAKAPGVSEVQLEGSADGAERPNGTRSVAVVRVR